MTKIRTKAPAGFIDSEDDIRRGVRALRRACPTMRRVHDITGDPPLRRHKGGFAGLARIVVAQQLSTASAAAIWGRVATTVMPLEAEAMLEAGEASLRAAGLSRPKIRTLKALSRAVVEDGLDIDGLAGATEADVHDALTAVSGIGPWTADIYIMFCIGRSDSFAAGDLALQVAAQHAAGLRSRPKPDELTAMAETWRPWRGVAARLLWAYYPHMKKVAQGEPM